MSDELKIRLAAHVKRLRVERGMTQDDLAAKSGITKSFIGRVERDQRNASLDVVDALARALGVDPLDLLQPLEDSEDS